MPHEQLVELVDDVLDHMGQRGEYTVNNLFPSTDLRVVGLATPTTFSLLRVTPDPPNNRSHIQVSGAGARGVANSDAVARSVLEGYSDFDWGGPFLRTMGDETLTIGARLNAPPDLFTPDNVGAAFGFVFAMVNLLGEAARGQAAQVVQQHGGRVIDGRDDDCTHWFAALLGQLPPGFPGSA